MQLNQVPTIHSKLGGSFRRYQQDKEEEEDDVKSEVEEVDEPVDE